MMLTTLGGGGFADLVEIRRDIGGETGAVVTTGGGMAKPPWAPARLQPLSREGRRQAAHGERSQY